MFGAINTSFSSLKCELFCSFRWKQAADTYMAIQMNEPYRSSYITMRHGSLYDQTPIFGWFLELFARVCCAKFIYSSKIIMYCIFSDTFATKDSNSRSTLRIDMPITRSAHRASISTTDSLSYRRSSSSVKPRPSRLSGWPFSSKK